MLLYPGAGTEVVQEYVFEKQGKIPVITFSAGEIGGEYDRRGWLYIAILWSISLLTAVANLLRASLKKMKSRKPLKQILWEMGRDPNHFSNMLVDMASDWLHKTKVHAAGWKALDLFYNYHEKVLPKLGNNLEGRVTRYWMGLTENRQAIINRKKIVVRLLSETFYKFMNEPEIRMISIASGSAQAVMEAVEKSALNVRVVLIDVDKSALAEAERLAEEKGLKDDFRFIHGTPRSLRAICKNFQPHIIEMIGLLDYIPEEKAVRLINFIKKFLPAGGYFLTGNIKWNREKIILDWVFLWPMIYRNERQLGGILARSGFPPDKINIFYEPFQIHAVSVCMA